MKTVTQTCRGMLLVFVSLVLFAGCNKLPIKDTVWNRDDLGKIVDLEPAEFDSKDVNQKIDKVDKEEKEEVIWCNA